MKIETVELQIKRVHAIDIPLDNNYVRDYRSAGIVFCETIGNNNVEYVAMLSLDTSDRIINYSTVSIGDVHVVHVPVAQILKYALLSNASKIVIAHNHPSGTLEITPEDVELTRKIAYFSRAFDIELVDSLVVSGDKVISIRLQCKEL